MPLASAAQAITEGALLGLYRFQQYQTGRKENDRAEIDELTIISSLKEEAIERGASLGEVIARGTALARDLTNSPGNDLPPAKLAQAAEAVVAGGHPRGC